MFSLAPRFAAAADDGDLIALGFGACLGSAIVVAVALYEIVPAAISFVWGLL